MVVGHWLETWTHPQVIHCRYLHTIYLFWSQKDLNNVPRRLLSYYSPLPVSGKICRWERTSFWSDFHADKYQQSEIRRFSWMKARAKPSHPNPLCSPVMSRGSSNLSTVLCKFQKASLSCHHCSLTSFLEGAELTP